MAEVLQLRIVTPERQLLDETVEQVTAQGALGQFGVLPLHIAFLTALDPGILTYRPRGATATAPRIAVKGGFAEVRDDVVTILADEAVAAGEIDAAAARAKLAAAESAAAAAPYGHPDHDRLERDARWAGVLVALAAGA